MSGDSGTLAAMPSSPEPSASRSRFRNILDVVTTLAMLAAAVLLIWVLFPRPSGAPSQATGGARPPVRVPAEPVPFADASVIGDPNAGVAMLIFSDFECPFCTRFAETVWPTLKSGYVASGKVQAVFRHLPLARIHPRAVPAAEAAECAGRQGRFWEMHDALFAAPLELNDAALQRKATAIGLNLPKFTECLEGGSASRVAEDAKLARSLGLTGTPSVIVGVRLPDGRLKAHQVVVGAQPLATYTKSIDELLAKKAASAVSFTLGPETHANGG